MTRVVVVRIFLGITSIALGACATVPVLKPAPADTIAPGTKQVVQASDSGVQLLVAGDAWKGDPSDLGKLFAPVKVNIVNQSGKVLRVSYADFSLSGSSGFRYAAIPPMNAKGRIGLAPSRGSRRAQLALYQPPTRRVALAFYEPGMSVNLSERLVLAQWEHAYEHDHFFVAPHYAGWYPGWGVWPGAYPYDPLYYNNLYAYWPEKLPTQDMLSQALPEGAVQNGGTIGGFVYFQGVGDRESSVTFAMNLVDATDGQSFGQVSIPFEVSK